MSHKSLIKTVLGAANWGVWKNPQDPSEAFVPTAKGNAQDFMDVFKKHGFNTLDTARAYGGSEKILGELKVQQNGFIIDTKVFSFVPHAHTSENLQNSVKQSLEDLGVKKVHILYLHAPDRTTPFDETMKAINEIYQQGSFEKFGISNYTAEEVEQILSICRQNNYVLPSVYQGEYNAFARKNEEKLFPLLRKNQISFYAYSPLAAGFFLQKRDQAQPEGGRFNADSLIGKMYINKYSKPSFFDALDQLTAVTEKHQISNLDAAIRWIYHHSQLKQEHGDAIIIGASKTSQIDGVFAAAEKGPLPAEIADLFEELWKKVLPEAGPYHM